MKDQRQTPLLDALKEHIQAEKWSFHTPGHKGGRGAWVPFRDMLGGDVFRYDLTETGRLDDLAMPTGVIAQAEELAADLYGARRTFFLVQGSTVGVQAMLMAASSPGGRILLDRSIHRSAVAGLILSGARPVFIGAGRPIDAGTIDQELSGEPVQALFLVRPDYRGRCIELKEIARTCREHGTLLLVDEAHGPHLRFHPLLPESAVEWADVVVQSPHKLAGSLTQSAWLHVIRDEKLAERVGRALYVLQTSSPSYLLLASLDAARAQLATEGRKLLDMAISKSQEMRRAVERVPGFSCLQDGHFDPLKIVILTQECTGYQLAEAMQERGIYPESAQDDLVVLNVTWGDSGFDVGELEEALRNAPGSGCPRVIQMPCPAVAMTPREAFFSSHELCDLHNAPGRVAADVVTPYPPGIPALVPGEIIDREMVEYIAYISGSGHRVEGLIGGRLRVVIDRG
ncbi:MAG: aminotransferase class I/II-fold pyridoxal phosphate-dependent enzyme [Bacillota bacterium]